MGENRDYYADLELPPTADMTEIKKQFRKLALMYHPDRNPGREQEVNAKFQIIQSAHEVLGDATEKARYDSSRGSRAGRYPTASGRKGNPWSEAAQNFPPPPRRSGSGKPAASSGGGAQRWSSRFPTGVPPTAKQYTSADSETKKNAAKAFDTMRKSQAKKPQSKSSVPPPPPPRTQSAKERAESSFGTRKQPQAAPSHAGESDTTHRRPVPNFHNVDANFQQPMPDPLSQFRKNASQSESRYTSQYATHGGERFNPFEGIQRRPSMRESRDDDSRPSQQGDMRNGSAGAYARSSYKPQAQGHGGADGIRTQSNSDSKYAFIPIVTPHKTFSAHDSFRRLAAPSSFYGSLSSVYNPQNKFPASDEYTTKEYESPQFERLLQDVLNRLIETNNSTPSSFFTRPDAKIMSFADERYDSNFEFHDDNLPNSDGSRFSSRHHPANEASFYKDNISTDFSDESLKTPWNFTANSTTHDQPDNGQPNESRPGAKQGGTLYTNAPGTETEAPGSEAGFNPGGWSDKFGPQTFVPQQAPAASISPTRASRTNSKKNKPVKNNANNPIIIDDSEDELYEWSGRKAQTQGPSVETPQAMDIDTPPAVPPRPSPNARAIYVEPTRPEWRTADEMQAAGESSAAAKQAATPGTAHLGGSEDSEEFQASFADLKNVAPLSQPAAGLTSFAELRDNLPFESKSSGEVPTSTRKVQPLAFPTPPVAPRLPPTVAIEGMVPNAASWNKYLEDFGMYLQEWELFNTQVVDHFATRSADIKRLRESEGYAFLGSRSDDEIHKYMSWVQQDNDVRRRWNAACEVHEERLEEFMVFRSKVK